MQKPDSNLNSDAQPWGRWVEHGQGDQDTRIDTLGQRIDSLSRGDGEQAGIIAALQAKLELTTYELIQLYALSGTPYPPGSTPPAPAPAPVPTTTDIGADWSRTWGSSSYYTGGGTHTNATYLYQGSNPENKIGMWHFNTAPILGKTILSAQMFMANIDAPWSASFVAGFGTHGNAAAPVGKPGRVNPFDVGWGRGEAKWVAIPDWALGGLSNGTIQGFTVGGFGASDANSAYFQGVGQPAPPVLRVTYNA